MKMNFISCKHNLTLKKMTGHSHAHNIFQPISWIVEKRGSMQAVGQSGEESWHNELKDNETWNQRSALEYDNTYKAMGNIVHPRNISMINGTGEK